MNCFFCIVDIILPIENSGEPIIYVNRQLERVEIQKRIKNRTLLTSKGAKLTKPGRSLEKYLEFVDGIYSLLIRAIEYMENDAPPSM